jgi:hypothetical protein
MVVWGWLGADPGAQQWSRGAQRWSKGGSTVVWGCLGDGLGWFGCGLGVARR